MTCANHPEAVVAAYCRTCGKPLCVDCKREAEGTIFCAEHVPLEIGPKPPVVTPLGPPAGAPVYASPYTAPPGSPLLGSPASGSSTNHSPALAFILGLIPGVGAIYNGQYAKGLIHAVIFGLLISLLSGSGRYSGGMEPLLSILLTAWIFYMAFEAFHTAKVKRSGGRPGEVSGLMDMDRTAGKFPIGAIILIGLGGILLLDTTNLISIERLAHLWPVGLILIGVYLLYERMSTPGTSSLNTSSRVSPVTEARDESR